MADSPRSTPAYEKKGTGPTGGWAGQSNGTPKTAAAGQAQQRHYWRQGLREVIHTQPR